MANAPRGQVQVQRDIRGSLMFQIPSIYADQYYQRKQKYIRYGTKDTPENRRDAMTAALEMQSDLDAGKFDPSEISKYRHLSKNIEPYSQPDINVVSLFTKFTEQAVIHDSTRLSTYKIHLNHLNKMYIECNYTLKKQAEIYKWIRGNVKNMNAVKLLAALNRMVKWGIQESKLPKDFVNKFCQYESELKKSLKSTNTKRKPPTLTSHLIRDYDYVLAWSEVERDAIIEAFHSRSRYKPDRNRHNYLAYLVEFLFNTGCRHGEAFSLTWRDVQSDFKFISINKSYCSILKKTKGTKTGKNRKVPTNSRVQEILKTIKPEDVDLDSLVFINRYENTFTSSSLSMHWIPRLTKTGLQRSVIGRLIDDGKLTKYIDSYGTRRTFVSIQINKGVPVTTVAMWVGDNPETILKYYARGDDDAVPY